MRKWRDNWLRREPRGPSDVARAARRGQSVAGAPRIPTMILEIRAAPPFFKNGFVVGCEETREAVVIDPGDDVEELLEAVDKHKLQVRYILLTHAHIDHITGVRAAKKAL